MPRWKTRQSAVASGLARTFTLLVVAVLLARIVLAACASGSGPVVQEGAPPTPAPASVRVCAARPAAASEDGTARIWSATPEGFLIQACQYLRPWPAYAEVAEAWAPWVDKTP